MSCPVVVDTNARHAFRWWGRLLRWLVRLALLVALVLTVLAIVGDYLPAEKRPWRHGLITPFRWQYSVVAIGAMIAAVWLRPMRLTFAIATLTLLANLWVIGPWLAPSFSWEAKPSERFTMMSWNTWSQNPDPLSIVSAVVEASPDLVFLCEIPRVWETQPPIEIPGYQTYHRQQFIIGVKNDGPMQVIAPLERPALTTTLEYQGRAIRFFGHHLTRPTTPNGAHWQQRVMNHWGKLMLRAELPVICTGDCNLTPWCKPLREFKVDTRLKDTSLLRGICGTYPSNSLGLNRVAAIPIDHCLHSAELRCLKSWVGYAGCSNHNPIFMEFAWAESDLQQEK